MQGEALYHTVQGEALYHTVQGEVWHNGFLGSLRQEETGKKKLETSVLSQEFG
jgi:hypothetical protein